MATAKEKREQLMKQAVEDGAKNCYNKYCERGYVRSAENAKELILEHLEKDSRGILQEKEVSADEVMWFIEPVVDELYKRYGENWVVPTLQALMEGFANLSDKPAGILPAIGNMDDPFTEPAKKGDNTLFGRIRRLFVR